MIELVSTRGSGEAPLTYDEALLQGQAPDGGLYVPLSASYPRFKREELRHLQDLSYADLATKVKGRLIDGTDINYVDRRTLDTVAYDPEVFPGTENGDIAPVTEVDDNLYIKNLSLGPTAAFKDFGLRSLAQEVGYMLDRQGHRLTILGATSGDTGSAAEHAFKDIGRVSMFMLSPANGSMTPFQRAQMGVLSDERTHNLSLATGGFDGCQDIVKQLKKEIEFKDLGAVNSINWGRVVAQTVYYFDAYRQVAGGNAEQLVDFVVPSGNLGNALAGHIAKRMGLPVRLITVATNENNVMHRLISQGSYVQVGEDERHTTSSPSMDISKASNYERLAYEMFEGDGRRTRAYMEQFEREGRVDFADHGLSPQMFRRYGIVSGSSNHINRIKAIQNVYRLSGVIIDPHTADGVSVARHRGVEIPTICLATAESVKFEDTVREAIGVVAEREDRFRDLESRPGAGNFTVVESIEDVRNYIREHRV